MRSLSSLVVFLLAGVALLLLSLSNGSSAFPRDRAVSSIERDHIPFVKIHRKLKGGDNVVDTTKNKRNLDGFTVEDYPRFDPVPSSKAAIKNGPIEHGTPLLPYIPRPTPPSHPSPRHGSP